MAESERPISMHRRFEAGRDVLNSGVPVDRPKRPWGRLFVCHLENGTASHRLHWAVANRFDPNRWIAIACYFLYQPY